MAVQSTQATRGGGESSASDEETSAMEEGEAASSEATPAATLGSWLPLGAALIILPALAYVVTTFVIVPHMQKALQASAATAVPAASETAGRDVPSVESSEGQAAIPKAGQKQNIPLNKLLVNVAGTMGSRYLLTSIVVSGTAPDLQNRVAQNEAQLRDLATGLLCTKSITDLEKPGARNLIRGELLSAFNNVLGHAAVQDIYFTEFAIQ